MAIKRIDILSEAMAEQIWRLQHIAYAIEAARIGVKQAPPLMETVTSLQCCKETFIGWEEEDELYGALSYKRNEDTVSIDRLMVHPEHFRRGIADALLDALLSLEKASHYKVSAASRNEPAIQLYKKWGFQEVCTTEVLPGVLLTQLTKEGLSRKS